MYLKDYHRKRILEGDATADNSDDDVTSRRPMTHVEEQERLKQELKVKKSKQVVPIILPPSSSFLFF